VTIAVSQIGAIPLIGGIPPLQLFTPVIQPSTIAGSFSVKALPATVQQELKKGSKSWREAARAAIDAGITDPKVIADIIFFTQHLADRVQGDVGKLIEKSEPDFMKLRAEWEHDLAIANRFLKPGFVPDVFLPEQRSTKYEEFVTRKTTGKVTMMVHGRNWAGTGVDKFRNASDYYDRMEQVVSALGDGDVLYIANWQFAPWGVSIPADAPSLARNWQHLLTERANAGVRIRALISQHPPFSSWVTDTASLDAVIGNLDDPDRFKYVFMPHVDARGTHHQKFVVARNATGTVAFCGGLDLSVNRVPHRWATNFVWHDVAAKVEGLVAHDLERQFVEMWNLGRTLSTNRVAGWKPLERLTMESATSADKVADSNGHAVQMWRTVSRGPFPRMTQRDDIWRGYHRIIARSRRFLYLENQYFSQPELADAIVRQVQSSPGMIVIVAVGTGTDDLQAVDPKADAFKRAIQQALVDGTNNAFALRLEFFKRLQALSSTFLRIYTVQYPGGTIHSKFILGDDEVLSVGSANANPRGFIFDTEVNVVVDHPESVSSFRHALWAHNLGLPAAEVAKWSPGEFFSSWDAIAKSNLRQEKTPEKMVGERVIPFEPSNPSDPRFRKGRRGKIRLPLGAEADAPEGLF
jgi:phosphatidylserine/phosphatidylglycerophosphate/cardiolipin synthase-like enzyme